MAPPEAPIRRSRTCQHCRPCQLSALRTLGLKRTERRNTSCVCGRQGKRPAAPGGTRPPRRCGAAIPVGDQRRPPPRRPPQPRAQPPGGPRPPAPLPPPEPRSPTFSAPALPPASCRPAASCRRTDRRTAPAARRYLRSPGWGGGGSGSHRAVAARAEPGRAANRQAGASTNERRRGRAADQ